MVSKSSRKGKAFARGRDRKVATLCEAFTSFIVCVIRGRRGPTAVCSHGRGHKTPAEFPRRTPHTSTCHQYEYTKFLTAALTARTRGGAWRTTAIFLTWRPDWQFNCDRIRELVQVNLKKKYKNTVVFYSAST